MATRADSSRTVRLLAMMASAFTLVVLLLPSTAFGAAVWSARTPVPGSAVAAVRPVVSVHVDSDVPLLPIGASWLKVDGLYLRRPVLTFDKNPDGSTDYTAATFSSTVHWTLANGTHRVDVAVYNANYTKNLTSWTFKVGVPPSLSGETPAPGDSISTTTPTISAVVGGGGPITSYDVTVDGSVVPATLVGGVLSAPVSSALSNDSSHTMFVSVTNAAGMSTQSEWDFYVQTLPKMPATVTCTECHLGYPVAHPVDECAACHGAGSPLGNDYDDPAMSHAPGTLCYDCHGDLTDCGRCHGTDYATVPPLHDFQQDAYHYTSITECTPCHQKRLTVEHYRFGLDCLTCHRSVDPKVVAAIAAGDTACTACHDGGHAAQHQSTLDPLCEDCHTAELTSEHIVGRGLGCATCHESSDPAVVAAIAAEDTACTACHPGAGHQAQHDSAIATECQDCHTANLLGEHVVARGLTCATCHASAIAAVAAAIEGGDTACSACHPDTGHLAVHDSVIEVTCADCHQSNLVGEHVDVRGFACATCHSSADPAVVSAIGTGDVSCGACHPGAGHAGQHDSPIEVVCEDCHAPNLIEEHLTARGLACATCHSSVDVTVTQAIVAGDTSCVACHTGAGHTSAHDSDLAIACQDCHESNLVVEHVTDRGLGCATCHSSTDAVVLDAIASGDKACLTCHDFGDHPYPAAIHQATVGGQAISGTLRDINGTTLTQYDGTPITYAGETCGQCHLMDLSAEHAKPSSVVAGDACAACHASPRDTFETWNQTCQQGGCHATYHSDMSRRHHQEYVGQEQSCGTGDGACHGSEWQSDLAAVHATAWRYGGVFDDLSSYTDGCAICHSSAIEVPAVPAACNECHTSRHATATYP